MLKKTGISIALTALLLPAALCVDVALAEGHGPTFALATPTLGEGQWSSDTTFLLLDTTDGTSSMFGQMFGYGLATDLDLNLGIGSPMINRQDTMPRTRGGSMMSTLGSQIELTGRWRFHREAPGVGERRESTLILGGSAPYESRIGDMKIGPSINVGAVTGYASREWYWWIGGGYQRYAKRSGDRLGDLPYATATVGWRPPYFQREDTPDLRFFLEAVAEFPQRNTMGGRRIGDSGGERVLLGPTFLYLDGQWGLSGGVMFPVHQRLNGNQPRENVRARFVLTYWF